MTEEYDEALRAYDQRLDRIWGDLARAVRTMREDGDPKTLAYCKVVEEAIYGDPSMCNLVAFELSLKLGERTEPFNAAENFFLFWLLQRVEEDDTVALALVADAPGKGRPKSGAKALALAAAVIDRVMTTDVRSMEKAWDAVSGEYNVSSDTVKRSWSRWKTVALQLEGLEEGTLTAHLAGKRGK